MARTGLALVLTIGAFSGAANAQVPAVIAPPAGKPNIVSLGSYDLATLGYTLDEHFLTGTATSFKTDGPPSSDGMWAAKPDQTAPFATRILVARPEPGKFSGTVVVEWLNVTGGGDTPVDWWTAHRELLRRGHVWIGVSAQKVGVDGGPSAMPAGGLAPLKKSDPVRYAALSHPGDAWSYDIYTQVGRLLRSPGAGGVLGSLAPKRIIAMGESQSAVFLTSYVNAAAPLARAYDGYLIHSRFAPAAPLAVADSGSLMRGLLPNIRIRTDLKEPVIVVNTESDVLGGGLAGTHSVRQPDTDRLRIWEIPGTSHADAYLGGASSIDTGSATPEALAKRLAPSTLWNGMTLPKPINTNPAHHYVVETALRGLDRWIATGKAPPHGNPIALQGTGATAAIATDAHGNALGGIRNPWVDAPVARFSGVGSSPMASLSGVTEPFDKAKLAQLYPRGKADYVKQFQRSLDAAVKAGFILVDDREEALAVAAAGWDLAQ